MSWSPSASTSTKEIAEDWNLSFAGSGFCRHFVVMS